jgi:hypothetical protein
MSSRLAGRLGLSANSAPEKIEADLQKLVPQGGLDAGKPFAHLARTPALRRAQAGLRGMRNQEPLPDRAKNLQA